MAIVRLQHFGITVSDHRAAGVFYSEVIGIKRMGSVVQKPTKSMIGKTFGVPTVRICWHQRGYDGVELFHFPDAPTESKPSELTAPGPKRLAFIVPDLDIIKRKLEAKKIEFKPARDAWGDEYLGFLDADFVRIAAYEKKSAAPQLYRATIIAADLDTSIDFYKRVLKLPEISEIKTARMKDIFPDAKDDRLAKIVRLGIGGRGVELVEIGDMNKSRSKKWYPDPGDFFDIQFTTPGIRHVCFQAENSREWAVSLAEDGVRIVMGPAKEPTGLWVTYTLDPDGTVVELYDLPKFQTEAMRIISNVFSRFSF